MAPSPTAEAIRLTEFDRTSPAQKIPGTFVSSRNGWRVSGQPCGTLADAREIGTRQDEAGLVAFDQVAQPVRAGRLPDEDEHRGDRQLFRRLVALLRHVHRLERLAAVEGRPR